MKYNPVGLRRNPVGVTWAPTGAGAVAQRLVYNNIFTFVSQLEDQAMEEIRMYYENSKKSNPRFKKRRFVVSRLPYDVAQQYYAELEQL